MTARADIFRLESGGLRWLEAAATIECAKARIQEMAKSLPGEYLLLDQHTGNKLVFKLEGADQGPGR